MTESSRPPRFARRVYAAAGIYGLVALLPMYFLESKYGVDHPPAVTHPEFFYGFVGVAVAWQIAFLVIARDPLRYRPLMPATLVEKFSFTIAVTVLYFGGRTSGTMFGASLIDGLLGCLFLAAYLRTPRVGYDPRR